MLTPEQHKAALRNEYNFDHPGKVDEGRIVLWSYPNEYILQSFLQQVGQVERSGCQLGHCVIFQCKLLYFHGTFFL